MKPFLLAIKIASILLTLGFLTPSLASANSQCSHFYGAYKGDQFQKSIDDGTQSKRIKGNEVIIHPENIHNYNERLRMIRSAKNHINIYTLLFENNKIGKDFISEVATRVISKDKVEANVLMHYLSHALGSDVRLISAIRAAGIKVKSYWPKNTKNPLYFLIKGAHKKVQITDSPKYGLEAIVGGRNIGDNYLGNIPNPGNRDFKNIWRDTDLLIRGPFLNVAQNDFI